VLLLFSASAMTGTGYKSFDCALVSTMETYDDPENGNYVHYTYHLHYGDYYNYCYYFKLFRVGWLESVGSRVVYELDYKKTDPIRRSHSEYPGQTSLAQVLSRTACATPLRVLPAIQRWMLDVVRQLVGVGMVP
jgi:hypothetical protein